MLKNKCLILFAVLWLFALSAGAQDTIEPAGDTGRVDQRSRATRQRVRSVTQKLYSPLVSETFFEIAYELTNTDQVAKAEADQALMMLVASAVLDERGSYVLADMIRIASNPSHAGRSQMVYDMFLQYVNKLSDIDVADKAVRYLLEQLSSREQREMMLGQIIRQVGSLNPALDSELTTLYGLLKAEVTDDPNALRLLAYAYNIDKYNQLAYEKLTELSTTPPNPIIHLEYLRLKLRENPLDMETAMTFAQFADRLQLYELATDSYEYCAELFMFKNPNRHLPAMIYLPWSVCSYNTKRNLPKCLQIAETLRNRGRFDLLAEAIAGKAAVKIGNIEQAESILQAAEEKAIRSALQPGPTSDNQQLAWFYCFVRSDHESAIDWANRAYSAEPNSATAAAILAYVLAKDGQTELAETLVGNYEQNQIATLTLALAQIAKADTSTAIETLKFAIDMDGGSLAAEKAKKILAEHGADYIPLIDPVFIMDSLEKKIGGKITPKFVRPENIVSFQINLRGNKFSYGTSFGASVAIVNNWSEALVISDDALVKGYVIIDAKVTGDLNEEIRDLAKVRIRPSSPIEPGQSVIVPIGLERGRLKELLLSHPQASVTVEFTGYLDPVITADGGKINTVPTIPTAGITITRSPVEISREFLDNRLKSLTRGRQGQKIKAAQLFAGLLLEQHIMTTGKLTYKVKYADWMPDILKSALIHSLTNDDWVVRVHTMNAIQALPLDYELTDAVSSSLNDTNWPARLMAMYVLAKKQGDGFQKVLDYSAQYDPSEHVRNMAVTLGAAPPVVPQPLEEQTQQQEPPEN